MATAKERWSVYRYDPVNGSATRGWDVTGASSATVALTASGISKINDPFLPGSPLLCRGPYIDQMRAPNGHYYVRADFGNPPTGDWTISGDDPLKRPLEIEVDVVETTEAVDKDLDDRPILDAAGNALQGSTRTITYIAVTCYKFHPRWKVSWQKDFGNAVNENAMTFLGERWPAQHIKCCWVKPVGRFRWLNPKYVEIAGRLELVFEGTLGDYPFQSRLMNTALSGWYTGSGGATSAAFTRYDGENWERVSEPVKVDDDGFPMDATVKVGKGNAAIANPSPISTYAWEAEADATFSIWKKTRLVNLAGLNSIFY